MLFKHLNNLSKFPSSRYKISFIDSKHNKMKKLIIIALIGIASLSSCKKQLLDKYEQEKIDTPTAKKFAEIKADANFDWKTAKKIVFNYQSMQTISEINATLSIMSVDGKVVFYTGNQLMNKDMQLTLIIPAHINEIVVKYGAITKSFSTNSSQVNFNVLPTETNE